MGMGRCGTCSRMCVTDLRPQPLLPSQRDPECLLSSRELAEHLKVAVSTLSQWRAAGEGPKFIEGPRMRLKYKWADVLKWEALHTYNTTAERWQAREEEIQRRMNLDRFDPKRARTRRQAKRPRANP